LKGAVLEGAVWQEGEFAAHCRYRSGCLIRQHPSQRDDHRRMLALLRMQEFCGVSVFILDILRTRSPTNRPPIILKNLIVIVQLRHPIHMFAPRKKKNMAFSGVSIIAKASTGRVLPRCGGGGLYACLLTREEAKAKPFTLATSPR
jgi:hypothetical protein